MATKPPEDSKDKKMLFQHAEKNTEVQAYLIRLGAELVTSGVSAQQVADALKVMVREKTPEQRGPGRQKME